MLEEPGWTCSRVMQSETQLVFLAPSVQQVVATILRQGRDATALTASPHSAAVERTHPLATHGWEMFLLQQTGLLLRGTD